MTIMNEFVTGANLDEVLAECDGFNFPGQQEFGKGWSATLAHDYDALTHPNRPMHGETENTQHLWEK